MVKQNLEYISQLIYDTYNIPLFILRIKVIVLLEVENS